MSFLENTEATIQQLDYLPPPTHTTEDYKGLPSHTARQCGATAAIPPACLSADHN